MMKTKTEHQTREQWLESAVALMRPLFTHAGYQIPKVRVSCGWPSSRGLSAKRKALGECWSTESAEDKISQIFISPWLKKVDDAYGVFPVLAHEVVHAVVGHKAKHGATFRKCALAIGLEGKMTATSGGKEFLGRSQEWLKQLGEYPHARLNPASRPTKKQTTRMVKCECKECGYSVRTSRKWLEQAGASLCPCNKKPMAFKIPEELEGDDE